MIRDVLASIVLTVLCVVCIASGVVYLKWHIGAHRASIEWQRTQTRLANARYDWAADKFALVNERLGVISNTNQQLEYCFNMLTNIHETLLLIAGNDLHDAPVFSADDDSWWYITNDYPNWDWSVKFGSATTNAAAYIVTNDVEILAPYGVSLQLLGE